jgi:hypothetical protein
VDEMMIRLEPGIIERKNVRIPKEMILWRLRRRTDKTIKAIIIEKDSKNLASNIDTTGVISAKE